jgi:hypothetical protein
MTAPLPAQAAADEWQQHLQELSDRAERLIKPKNPDINAHAELALAAFRVLWSGWSAPMILSSVKAPQLVGTAVISGRPIAGQLLELEEQMAAWAEESDQMQPEPVNVMLPELLLPPGSLPKPAPPKKTGRRQREHG